MTVALQPIVTTAALAGVSVLALIWLSAVRPRAAYYLLLALTPTQFVFVPLFDFFISPADVLVAGAGGGLLLRLARRDARAWLALRLHLPLALMIASYCLGFLVLDHFSRTLVRVPMAIIPSILACELLSERRYLGPATAALIVAGIVDASYGAFRYAAGDWLHPSRFSGMMGVNFSAIVIVTAAVVAFARLGRTQRPLGLILPIALTLLGLATLSKMAIVTLLVTWLVLLRAVVSPVNRTLVLAAGLLAVAAGLSHPVLRQALLARAGPELQQDGIARSSTEVRLRILHTAWQGIAAQPFVGVGYRNFEKHSTRDPAIMASTHGEGYATHNTYLEVLAEGGLLAFVPFLIFFWQIVGHVASVWPLVTRRGDQIAAAAIAGLPVVLLSATSANVLLHYLFWAVCGLALACARIYALELSRTPRAAVSAVP